MATDDVTLLTTLNLVKYLTDEKMVLKEDSDVQHVSAVEAWKHCDFLCRNYILNSLDNGLYNIYCVIETAKELWDTLANKYKTEAAGVEKFIVGRFLDYTMTDSKSVMSQVQEFQLILQELKAESMLENEAFQLREMIEKLPPGWKDFKNYLRHKNKDMTLEDLILKLRVEEDSRSAERMIEKSPEVSKVHVIEGRPKPKRKRSGQEAGSDKPIKRKQQQHCQIVKAVLHWKQAENRTSATTVNLRYQSQANCVESH